ncbi:hypothetical protein AHF37_11515 [Paragonimus kellicotti]|nr:hypothetical protein AHF37_11515 [Paragonimus kellicotti]
MIGLSECLVSPLTLDPSSCSNVTANMTITHNVRTLPATLSDASCKRAYPLHMTLACIASQHRTSGTKTLNLRLKTIKRWAHFFRSMKKTFYSVDSAFEFRVKLSCYSRRTRATI